MKYSIVFVILLIGCGRSKITEVRAPNGKSAFAIECRKATDCYQLAGEACPYGYRKIEGNSASEFNAFASGNFFMAGTSNRYSALIECSNYYEEQEIISQIPKNTNNNRSEVAPTIHDVSKPLCEFENIIGEYIFLFKSKSNECHEIEPFAINMKYGFQKFKEHIDGCVERYWTDQTTCKIHYSSTCNLNNQIEKNKTVLQYSVDGNVLTGFSLFAYEDAKCGYSVKAIKQ